MFHPYCRIIVPVTSVPDRLTNGTVKAIRKGGGVTQLHMGHRVGDPASGARTEVPSRRTALDPSSETVPPESRKVRGSILDGRNPGSRAKDFARSSIHTRGITRLERVPRYRQDSYKGWNQSRNGTTYLSRATEICVSPAGSPTRTCAVVRA